MRSIYPRRFDDNGTDLHLDVHGCSVDNALGIIRRAVKAAFGAGRARVVVIHGASTSESGVRTIKSELERLVEEGAFSERVSGARWSPDGGQCTLWLKVGRPADPRRLRVNDVVRRA